MDYGLKSHVTDILVSSSVWEYLWFAVIWLLFHNVSCWSASKNGRVQTLQWFVKCCSATDSYHNWLWYVALFSGLSCGVFDKSIFSCFLQETFNPKFSLSFLICCRAFINSLDLPHTLLIIQSMGGYEKAFKRWGEIWQVFQKRALQRFVHKEDACGIYIFL